MWIACEVCLVVIQLAVIHLAVIQLVVIQLALIQLVATQLPGSLHTLSFLEYTLAYMPITEEIRLKGEA